MEPSTFLPDMEETSNLLQTTSGLETDKQQFGSSIPIEYKDDDTRVQPAVKSNHSLDTSSVPDDVTEKFHWDASEANSVARLKHGEDASDEKRIRAFINLIKFHKQDKNPSGLISRKGQRKITLYKGMYREGIDFELAGCLGHGIIAGDVMTIKDKTTGELIAQKRVLISNFKPEEILASIALEKTLYPPEWYLFQLETNRIAMYMDIVRDAIRLDVIINDYMMKMDKRQRQAFSLFVFDGLLEAIEKMSDENWVHGDLHGGNVMIQNTLYSIRIRILDFGQAKKTRNIKQDIIQAVRHFSGLYIGDQFNDEHHLERTFADNEMKMAWTQTIPLEGKEKEYFIVLMEEAMRITDQVDIKAVRESVQSSPDQSTFNELIKQCKEVLFPNKNPVSLSSNLVHTKDSLLETSKTKQHRTSPSKSLNYRKSNFHEETVVKTDVDEDPGCQFQRTDSQICTSRLCELEKADLRDKVERLGQELSLMKSNNNQSV